MIPITNGSGENDFNVKKPARFKEHNGSTRTVMLFFLPLPASRKMSLLSKTVLSNHYVAAA